jgi:hypothetical protein
MTSNASIAEDWQRDKKSVGKKESRGIYNI